MEIKRLNNFDTWTILEWSQVSVLTKYLVLFKRWLGELWIGQTLHIFVKFHNPDKSLYFSWIYEIFSFYDVSCSKHRIASGIFFPSSRLRGSERQACWAILQAKWAGGAGTRAEWTCHQTAWLLQRYCEWAMFAWLAISFLNWAWDKVVIFTCLNLLSPLIPAMSL